MPDASQLITAANQIMKSLPFNQLIQMDVTDITINTATVRFDMRPELIGNHIHGILHGGVIATVLDMTGGIMVMSKIYEQHHHLSPEEQHAKIGKTSTISMHVDYLQPGRGKYFLTTATLLRSGNKVAVTRMEMLNDQQKLIAVASGNYLIG